MTVCGAPFDVDGSPAQCVNILPCPIHPYQTVGTFRGHPTTPAVIVGDHIVVEGFVKAMRDAGIIFPNGILIIPPEVWSSGNVVNCQVLLDKYMRHVADVEGTTFVRWHDHEAERFTEQEWAVLKQIAETIESPA